MQWTGEKEKGYAQGQTEGFSPSCNPCCLLVSSNIHSLASFLFIYLCLSCSMGDLVPWSGIDLKLPALGAQSLSHWTTKSHTSGTDIQWTCLQSALFLLSSSHLYQLVYNGLISFYFWLLGFLAFVTVLPHCHFDWNLTLFAFNMCIEIMRLANCTEDWGWW